MCTRRVGWLKPGVTVNVTKFFSVMMVAKKWKEKKKSGLWPKKAYAYLLTLFCEGCWTNLWNRAVFYNREKAEAAPVITLYVSSSSGIVPIWYRVTWDARHPMDLSPALRRHPLLMESNFLLLLVGLNLTSIYSV